MKTLATERTKVSGGGQFWTCEWLPQRIANRLFSGLIVT